MDYRKCQTATATPPEAGDLPLPLVCMRRENQKLDRLQDQRRRVSSAMPLLPPPTTWLVLSLGH
jgi:hypothetical protein